VISENWCRPVTIQKQRHKQNVAGAFWFRSGSSRIFLLYFVVIPRVLRRILQLATEIRPGTARTVSALSAKAFEKDLLSVLRARAVVPEKDARVRLRGAVLLGELQEFAQLRALEVPHVFKDYERGRLLA
jgi:hypothetical protein